MGEEPAAGPGQDLDWLLDDLAGRVEHFRQAVILSRDGLPIAATRDVGREDAERLSALAAGLQSLAGGAGQHFGAGEVRQTIVELEQALLFVTSAGHRSCFAVLCPADAALQMYEQTRAGYERVLGPDHPDTLARCANLASAYYAVGRLTDARTLLRDILACCERVLPPGDPLSQAVRENLTNIGGD